MSRPVRIPVIVSALVMLVGGCDLLDKDEDRKMEDSGDDMAAEDEGGDEEDTDAEDTAGDTDAGDGGTGGGGTGEPLTPCQQCAAVQCGEETMPCAADQVCQDCAFGDPSTDACAANDAWQQALACACERCPDACTDICG